MVGLTVTSKRAYAKGHLQGLLLPCPCPHGKPLPSHTSTGDPPTLRGGLVQSLVVSLLLSPGSWCMHGFVCDLQNLFWLPCPGCIGATCCPVSHAAILQPEARHLAPRAPLPRRFLVLKQAPHYFALRVLSLSDSAHWGSH